MDFNNQKIWITGASSGIGQALARELALRGSHLLLSARTEDKLIDLKGNLNNPHNHHVLTMDVSDPEQLSSKVNEAIEKLGAIDVLINNAGISQRASAEETTMTVNRRIMEVNFFGNIALTKYLLPHWKSRSRGRVVVISSVAGKLGPPFRSIYAASKHALHGYYDALRAEVADSGIEVNVICPGYVQTDISRNALQGDGDKHGKMDEGQATGLSAEDCANRIIRAIEKNRAEVIIGKEWIFVTIRRFFPSIYRRFLRKRAQKGQF